MATRKTNLSASTPAPIGGLNYLSPISDMPIGDAIALINWIPQQHGLRCRKGYKQWATNLGAAVRSLMVYFPNRESTGSYRLFAATDSAVYNVSASTSSPTNVLALGGVANNGRMTSYMFTNSAGSYLVMCSHTGGYWTYDGTTWVKRVAGAGAGQINGVNPDNLVYVFSWKRRLWFIEKDTTKAWYLPTDSIAGTITSFDLGPFAKHGGKLAFICNWTIDAGEGIDDLLAFVFENGDVLVYKGTDPAAAATFSLQGAWYVGQIPLGRRAFTTMGGDVLLLSELGLQPLSYVTRGGQTTFRTNAVDYTAKIQSKLAKAFADNSTYLGWELHLFPKENLLLLTVPSGVTNNNQQYAMYTNTNAWTLFEGVPIRCATVAAGDFYFGDDNGVVYQGFTGYFDNVALGATVGAGITGAIQPAFSYFGAPGILKQIHMTRLTMLSVDVPAYSVQIAVDFQSKFNTPVTPVGISADSGKWSTAGSNWDAAYWAGVLNSYAQWVGAQGIGYAISPYVTTYTAGDSLLASIDYIYENGGPA